MLASPAPPCPANHAPPPLTLLNHCPAGDLLEGVDMSPLHRAVQIHACLRRLPALRDYYVENRRAQLEADLELQVCTTPPPAPHPNPTRPTPHTRHTPVPTPYPTPHSPHPATQAYPTPHQTNTFSSHTHPAHTRPPTHSTGRLGSSVCGTSLLRRCVLRMLPSAACRARPSWRHTRPTSHRCARRF